MSNIFICADLHFHHKNIIAYESRPWADRDAMDQGLIDNWNAVVNPEDRVYVLGDVGFCSTTKLKELVRQLHGHKILIMGNHDMDRSKEKWKEIGFDMVHRPAVSLDFNGRHLILCHEPPETFDPNVFTLYGHVHGNPSYPDWTPISACVSIERTNYAPAKLDDVISGAAYNHRPSKNAGQQNGGQL